jgi:hypothetical protein
MLVEIIASKSSKRKKKRKEKIGLTLNMIGPMMLFFA